uniref:Dipeptidyl peptidase 3 n=1 Tax=Sphenodon punctatus TaxID=8508 RepID=A0A8D0L5Z5_SPHPU
MVDSQYVLPNDIGIAPLDCEEAFRLLSVEERLYAHYLSRACWYGGLVVLLQTSPESPAIYVLLSRLFRAQDPARLGKLAQELGLSDEEYKVLNGQQLSSWEKLKQLVWGSQAFAEHPDEMEALWGSCGELMFSLKPRQKQLGLGDKVSPPTPTSSMAVDFLQGTGPFHLSDSMFRIIPKRIDNQTENIIMPLYKVMLRVHLDYCVQFWSPHLKKEIVKIEKVQRRPSPLTLGWLLGGRHGVWEPRDALPLGVRGLIRGLSRGSQFPHPTVSSLLADDDVRQTDGFKNVSLGNVLSVAYSTQKEKLTFLAEEDKDLYIKWKSPSFEVQVGLHELLGHGSGKLFVQVSSEEGAAWEKLQGKLVRSWYRGSETWDSKFSSVASSYEECRAECVGLYLCLNKEVLSIFDLHNADADDVIYINWLNMVRAGLLALEFYTPETHSWRQAHMQARYVILRVLLEAGGGLVSLKHTTGADGKPDALITLDHSKIISVGKPALEHFLCKLQVLKSTADVTGGRSLYEGYCAVTDDEPERFLTLRQTVLLRKEARKMFVQANTRLEGGDVALVQYEGSAAGLVRSFCERFPEDSEQLERHLLELANTDAHFWGSQD